MESYRTWSWSIPIAQGKLQIHGERGIEALKELGALDHSGRLKRANVRNPNTTMTIVRIHSARLKPYQQAF